VYERDLSPLFGAEWLLVAAWRNAIYLLVVEICAGVNILGAVETKGMFRIPLE
jgi:hypothetical protein